MLAFRPQDEAVWLASEPTWTSRIGNGWRIKVLGKGSFGVTGLWEYKGGDSNAPAIKQVVVKQTQFAAYDLGQKSFTSRSTLDEGNIGAQLAQIRSRHLIRQYGGNRLGDTFGGMDKVVRLFLEYCPGGDLNQFIPSSLEATGNIPPPLEELDVWQIFHCLAVGLMAMDKKTEDSYDTEWNGDDVEIMHCDLKADNGELPFAKFDLGTERGY